MEQRFGKRAAEYDTSYPSGDATLQRQCASGDLPADRCPGNRRWVQIMHDAMLLMPSSPSMVDARDGYLAADLARANDPALSWPSNQVELWRAFALRGLGQRAASAGSDDWDPRPDFSSPYEDNAEITFKLVAAEEGKIPVAGEVFVGRYEARAIPVADTIAATPLADGRQLAPGTYDFLVRANGYGHYRFTYTLRARDAAGAVLASSNRLRRDGRMLGQSPGRDRPPSGAREPD